MEWILTIIILTTEWGGNCASVWNHWQATKELIYQQKYYPLTFDNKENIYITSANSNKSGLSKKSTLFLLKEIK